MDVEQIREVRRARPFGRFTLVLDDGRHLPVEEPYYLAISPQGKELTYASDQNGFEHFAVTRVVRVLPGVVRPSAARGGDA